MGAVHRPPPALAAYVAGVTGYHHVLDEDVVHYGLPSPSLTVVLSIGEPLDVGWLADGETGRRTYWALAGGLHVAPALIRTHGFQHGIQLDLTPLGARALFGMPAAALSRTLVDHDDLRWGLGRTALEEIAGARSWHERFAVLDRALLARAGAHRHDPVHDVRPEVLQAWHDLEEHDGRVAIGVLADRLGWSSRHLTARFAEEYGVTPKQAARLFRFRRARRLVEKGLSWAETAYAAGYADQAHLSRDWRELAGQTPTESRELFRILQDGEPPPAPVSAA